MKTIFAIIGGLAIFVVAVFAALFAIGTNQIKPLTAEATAYADEAIPAIATAWEGSELTSRASPELMAKLPGDTLNGVMAFGERQLGPLTEYHGATCVVVNVQYTPDDGELVQTHCDARADHEQGGASYVLTLLKRSEAWSILGFFITPDAIKDTDSIARTVSTTATPLSALSVSLKGKSVSLTSGYTPLHGAHIDGFEKIENNP